MILRLQHIGTAHQSHASAAERLRQVGLEPAELRTDQGRGFQLDSRKLLGNECWLHVVHNWNPEARVCQYLRTIGEGLEHIAIETDDIEGRSPGSRNRPRSSRTASSTRRTGSRRSSIPTTAAGSPWN